MRKSAAVCGILLSVFLLGSTVEAATVARGMNFRSTPSATGSLIGSIPKGAEVEVLNSENGWDYVSYNGIGGWIHGGNITNTSSAQKAASGTGTAAASTAGTSGQTVKVLYGMNFRAKAGMDGRIMVSRQVRRFSIWAAATAGTRSYTTALPDGSHPEGPLQ